MLTVEKSCIVSPALGWMLFIVAATTLSKLWFVSIVLKKRDNLAASTKWSGQWSITANSFVPKIRSASGIHPLSHMVKFWSCTISTINWCTLSSLRHGDSRLRIPELHLCLRTTAHMSFSLTLCFLHSLTRFIISCIFWPWKVLGNLGARFSCLQ